MGGGVYPSAEMQSVYSTAPAEWTRITCDLFILVKVCVESTIFLDELQTEEWYSWMPQIL